MSSPPRSRQKPTLFDDLPLHPQSARQETPARSRQQQPSAKSQTTTAEPAEPLPLFPETERAEEPTYGRSPAPFYVHLQAGLLDLGVILAVLLMTWLGLWWMGVTPDLAGWIPLALFLLPFSFLYQVFPLAFWGRTPGMARVGIVARSLDGKSVSFSQAALRWAASALTVATLGLPLLLAASTGQSLADRLSRSHTLPAR